MVRGGMHHGGARVSETERIDVAALAETLLGRWSAVRRSARALAARPDLWKREGLSLAAERQHTLSRMSILSRDAMARRAFPTRFGGDADNGGNVVGFEELTAADPSLQIKAGVQWGLFGSAVLQLGTPEQHDRLLPDILSFRVPGAFAMTEIGHGSDVANLATTATYDPERQEFILDTPFRAAWKEFLGNAGSDARAATVFAQLVTDGTRHGVHCFYVPIRDEEGRFLPGVEGLDDGQKGGLNGVDNGRLAFHEVRVPRENLLAKYGAVAPDGTYSSPIRSAGRRFFTMLGTLVQGRVSLDGASVVAAKIALAIAVEYADQRRQFAGPGGLDRVLLDYPAHRRRLLPLVARTYAASFAHERLLGVFDDVFGGRADDDAARQNLETMAAALKPLSTWHALETLQQCREACGGAGFMTENRFTSLRADLDVYVTFEGDNTVLLQLVAKRLLSDYAARLKEAGPAAAREVLLGAAQRAVGHSGLRSLGQRVRDVARSLGGGVAWLDEEDTQRQLLTDRVETIVAETAGRLHARPGASRDAAVTAEQDSLIEAARAHGELLQWEAFTDALPTIADPATRQILTRLRDLFGLGLIEEHAAWYLMNGRLAPERARAVGARVTRLLRTLRPHALDLVHAFGYGPEHLRATIATGIERERQEEAQAHRDGSAADAETRAAPHAG
ncbi:MAG TPA: acyl-CoA dehydrogenase [Microbacteriaceae bacterium]|nr:acyl-CoA dehydrogenase [Microbacteriaceae bacterium]